MEQLKEFEETLFSDEQLALELENELNFCAQVPWEQLRDPTNSDQLSPETASSQNWGPKCVA